MKIYRRVTMLSIFGVIWAFLPLAVSQTYEDENELRANLSNGYNRFVRPSSPTNVTLYYNLRALQDLDITEQQMTLTGWLTAYWYDKRLVWDSANKINQIEINWGWRPEIVISNSATDFTRLGYKNDYTRLRVYYTGLVKWNQLIHSTTSCDVDISNFPFDTQVCGIEAIFWSYSEDEVVLINQYTEINTDVYLENAEWILDRTVVEPDRVSLCCPHSNHPIVVLNLTFTRRRPFYVMNLLFPTILLSVCMVWAFLLPTESGERLGYSLTILLAYTVQLSITAQLMPTTSKQVPQIAQYLLIVLIMCSAVTSHVVIHVKLFYLQQPVYSWVKAIYRKVYPIVFLDIRCCSGLNNKKPTNRDEVVNINKEMREQNFQNFDQSEHDVTPNNNVDTEKYDEVTWANVSVLLDRILFFGYVIAVSVVNGFFLYSIS